MVNCQEDNLFGDLDSPAGLQVTAVIIRSQSDAFQMEMDRVKVKIYITASNAVLQICFFNDGTSKLT
jgi:hypothetical protein